MHLFNLILDNKIYIDKGSSTVGKSRGKKLTPNVPLTIEIPNSESGDQLSLQSDSDSEYSRSICKKPFNFLLIIITSNLNKQFMTRLDQ